MKPKLLVSGALVLLGACGSSTDTATDGGADVAPNDAGTEAGDAGAGDAPSGALAITLSSSDVGVVAGATATFDVQANRGAATGDIALTVSGLPSGVTAAPATIAAGATKATITLSAASDAALAATSTFTVTATSGSFTASAMARAVVRGQPGTLDTTYGGGTGVVFTPSPAIVTRVALQPDDRLVLAGAIQVVPGLTGLRGWVGRFDAQGAPDSSFGNGGSVTLEFGSGGGEVLYGVAVQTDGKIVVAGYTQDLQSSGVGIVGRLDAQGALDPVFNATGKLTTSFSGWQASLVHATFVQSDGKIVALGAVASSTDAEWALVRLTAQGGTDAPFATAGKLVAPGLKGSASCAAQQSDGRLLVAGTTTDSQQKQQWTITRLAAADGSTDTTYGTNGVTITPWPMSNGMSACAKDAQERLVLVGATFGGSTTSFLLARYDARGLDASFGGGQPVSTPLGASTGNFRAPQSVLLERSGKIVLVGSSPIGFITVLRYTPDGALDPTFGSGGQFGIDAGLASDISAQGAIDGLGRVLVAGVATRGGPPGVFIARVWL